MPHARQLLNWIMAFFRRHHLVHAGRIDTFANAHVLVRWRKKYLKHVSKCRSPASATFILAPNKMYTFIRRVSCERHIHRNDTYRYALTVFSFLLRRWTIAPIRTTQILAHVEPQAAMAQGKQNGCKYFRLFCNFPRWLNAVGAFIVCKKNELRTWKPTLNNTPS